MRHPSSLRQSTNLPTDQITDTHVNTHTTMADTHTYKFNVSMSCSGCSGAVDRVLKKLEGKPVPASHLHPSVPPSLAPKGQRTKGTKDRDNYGRGHTANHMHHHRQQASSRTRSPSRARPPPSWPRTTCPTRRCSRPSPRRARRSTRARPTASRRASRSLLLPELSVAGNSSGNECERQKEKDG